jgi:hypothetical protein
VVDRNPFCAIHENEPIILPKSHTRLPGEDDEQKVVSGNESVFFLHPQITPIFAALNTRTENFTVQFRSE